MRPAILLALLLAGCGHLMPADPLTRPVLRGSNRPRPQVIVYRQCDKQGCRLYDGKGNRRVDCEREWATHCREY